MKLSHILIIMAALVVLVLVLFARTAHEASYRPQEVFVSLADIEPGNVDEIVIEKGGPGERVHLIKTGHGWAADSLWGVGADPLKVRRFLSGVRNLEGEKMSADAGRLSHYGLGGGAELSVKLYSEGKEILDLRVGKKSAGKTASFVRVGDTAEVFAVDEPLLKLMGVLRGDEELDPSFWADLNFFQEDPSGVRSIKIFRVEEGAPRQTEEAVQGRADNILAALRGGRGIRLVDPSGDYGFEWSGYRFEIGMADGRTIVLDMAAVTAEDGVEKIYLRHSEAPAVYEISPYLAQRLIFAS